MLEIILGMMSALALRRGLRGSRIFRAIFAMPLMVAPVVGALAWRFVFVDGYGMINSLMNAFGGEGPLWFADVWLAGRTPSSSPVSGWRCHSIFWCCLRGSADLPPDPLEAARVDGASATPFSPTSLCPF